MKFGILLSLFLVFTSPAWSQTTEVQKTQSEDEIPVNFSKAKKAETADTSNGRLFLTFGLMAIILGLGYYFAKKYGRPKNSPQTKIKILTQHYLGPKKSLAIVRVAGESILIGVTDQNINMIKSLSLLDDEIPEAVTTASFQETMKVDLSQNAPANEDNQEEFSIRHIKNAVSLKLKGIRNNL